LKDADCEALAPPKVDTPQELGFGPHSADETDKEKIQKLVDASREAVAKDGEVVGDRMWMGIYKDYDTGVVTSMKKVWWSRAYQLRSQAVTWGSTLDALNLFLDVENMAKWDPLIESVSVLPGTQKTLFDTRREWEPEWDERWLLIRYKCVKPMLRREALCRQIWGRLQDAVVVWYRSGYHPDMPRSMAEGIVRVQVMGNGAVIRRVPGKEGDQKNKDRLVLSMFWHYDLMGWVPPKVPEILTRQQPLQLAMAHGEHVEVEAAKPKGAQICTIL